MSTPTQPRPPRSRMSRGTRRLGRSLITLQPAPGRSRRALRWVAAVGFGLVATSLILGPSRGALGLLGAMAVNAGREEPFRRRLRLGLGVGAATLTCQAIGLLISPYPWLVPPVMAAITFVVVWVWHGLQIGPPGPINTVFAGAFGAYMGARGVPAAELLGTTGLAWLLATLASLALVALAPHAAEEEAVEAAESAVDAYCRAATSSGSHTDDVAASPSPALTSSGVGSGIGSTQPRPTDLGPGQPAPAPDRPGTATGQAEVSGGVGPGNQQGSKPGGRPTPGSPTPPPAATARTGTSGGVVPAQLAVLRSRAWRAVDDAWHVLRTGRTPGTVPLSAAGRALEERLRAAHLRLLTTLQAQSFPADSLAISEHFNLVPMGRPSARYLLHTAATVGSRPFLVASRAAAAVLLAASLAFASPIGHPYWAILSSLIVLHMGASRADLTIRAAHRVVGTALGVLVYFAIVSAHPGPWVQIGIVIVAIYGLEALVTRNYAVAVVFVTVFALMMTPVTSEAQVVELMRDRVVETVIGAASAALVIWAGGSRAPILLVRRQYRLTLESLLACLADLAARRRDRTQDPRTVALVGGRTLKPVRALAQPGALDPVRTHTRHLVFELGRAGVLLAGQRPDAPAALAPWTDLQREVSTFGYDVVAATWREPGAGCEAAALAYEELAALVASLPPISRRNIDPRPLAERVAGIRREYLAAA